MTDLSNPNGTVFGLMPQAADRIEALEAKLALARRDALEEAAEVAIRMEREMEVQDECGNEPFYTPEDVAQRIRAIIAAIKGDDK